MLSEEERSGYDNGNLPFQGLAPTYLETCGTWPFSKDAIHAQALEESTGN
jgi:hypothetical protein